VRGYYATITVDEALLRAGLRAKRTGRKVPEEKIRFTHAKVSEAFPTASGNMDEVFLYDTMETTPRLIAVGRGGTIEVLDRAGYEAFLNKAAAIR
jgi:predicted ABC-type ATPase